MNENNPGGHVTNLLFRKLILEFEIFVNVEQMEPLSYLETIV